MLRADVRARRRLPACRREGDPSLACFRKPAKQDKKKIQEGGILPPGKGVAMQVTSVFSTAPGLRRRSVPQDAGLYGRQDARRHGGRVMRPSLNFPRDHLRPIERFRLFSSSSKSPVVELKTSACPSAKA